MLLSKTKYLLVGGLAVLLAACGGSELDKKSAQDLYQQAVQHLYAKDAQYNFKADMKVKINIETKNVLQREGLIGGVRVDFSNTDYDNTLISILGTTPETTYAGSFTAHSTYTKFRMYKKNTDTPYIYDEVQQKNVRDYDNWAIAIFSNPIVSDIPDFQGSIFSSKAEVLVEAKHRWPLNADYGLPEKLPERNF